jgi:hypothetical protein
MMHHPGNLRWSVPWGAKTGDNANTKNPVTVQKERCVKLLGRKVLCVQDEAKAKVKITAGMLGVAALLVFLIVKR